MDHQQTLHRSCSLSEAAAETPCSSQRRLVARRFDRGAEKAVSLFRIEPSARGAKSARTRLCGYRASSRHKIALPGTRQTVDVPLVVLSQRRVTALWLQDQVLAERCCAKFPPRRRLEDIAKGAKLVDRHLWIILGRVGYHDPGLALGIVEQVDRRSLLESFDGRSRNERRAIGGRDRFRGEPRCRRQAVSHP